MNRLRVEEAEYVTEMARRIAALILMQPELSSELVQPKQPI
jgi:hypothetical protein